MKPRTMRGVLRKVLAMSDQEMDRAVLKKVRSRGELSPRQLESDPPGNLSKEEARHAMQRLLVSGQLYVNDRLRLAEDDDAD